MASTNTITMFCPVPPASGTVMISASYNGDKIFLNSSLIVDTNVLVAFTYDYVDSNFQLNTTSDIGYIYSGSLETILTYPGITVQSINITSVSPASSGTQTYTY